MNKEPNILNDLSNNNLDDIIKFLIDEKYSIKNFGSGNFCCAYLENPYEYSYQENNITNYNNLNFNCNYSLTLEELYAEANIFLISGDFHIIGFFENNNNITNIIYDLHKLPNQIIPRGTDLIVLK